MFGNVIDAIRRAIAFLFRALGLRLLSVSVTPTQGPAGTRVLIHVRGALAGDLLTIRIGSGTSSAVADLSGQATVQDTMAGFEPGTTVTIEVLAGPNLANAARASTRFQVTG